MGFLRRDSAGQARRLGLLVRHIARLSLQTARRPRKRNAAENLIWSVAWRQIARTGWESPLQNYGRSKQDLVPASGIEPPSAGVSLLPGMSISLPFITHH